MRCAHCKEEARWTWVHPDNYRSLKGAAAHRYCNIHHETAKKHTLESCGPDYNGWKFSPMPNEDEVADRLSMIESISS